MPHSILIVEDDLTFATMLKTWLGKKGFSVDTASSNARARKQLDAQPYDLVSVSYTHLTLPTKA